MIHSECKRLAEVDFPIAVVSKRSVRDLPVASLCSSVQDQSLTEMTPCFSSARKGRVLGQNRYGILRR